MKKICLARIDNETDEVERYFPLGSALEEVFPTRAVLEEREYGIDVQCEILKQLRTGIISSMEEDGRLILNLLNSDDKALNYPHKNVKGKFHEVLDELERTQLKYKLKNMAIAKYEQQKGTKMKTFIIKTNVKVGKDESVSRYNWTKEIVDSVLEQTKNIIAQDKMFVEALDEGIVTEAPNLDRACGAITNAYISEDAQIMVEVHALDTPMGNILNTLLEDCEGAIRIGIKMKGTVDEETGTPESVKVLGAHFDHAKRIKNQALI